MAKIGRTSQAIEAEIREIARKNRSHLIRRRAVVDYARTHRTSAIGQWFERRGAWREDKMAEKGRLALAGELIQMYVISLPDDTYKGFSGTVRGTVYLASDTKNHGGGVRLLGDVLANRVQQSEMVSAAMSELESVRRRWQHVKALVSVWDAMDEVKRTAIFPRARAA